MYARSLGASLNGIQPILVEIEVGLIRGLPGFQIVGLPDQSINEAKERINFALNSISYKQPSKFNYRTSVNLAPAEIKKEGPQLDLPIALAFLKASGQLKNLPEDFIFLGELGFDGSLRKIKGTLPILISAKTKGFSKVILPQENLNEAKYINGLEIYTFSNLREVIDFLEGRKEKIPETFEVTDFEIDEETELIFDPLWERIVLIAAAGRHNLILAGPPGTGKTLIAENIRYLLPELSYEESLEISKIYSALGILDKLIKKPPFRSPHHSASSAAILGGGRDAKPGEITLAHLGVLLFDELPEFRRDVLEGIREPLEKHKITITRAKEKITYPAKFLFIGTLNPCPCGFYGDPQKECLCNISEIKKYHKKISGPIIDRIDLYFYLPRMDSQKMLTLSEIKLSSFRDKVLNAIERMKQRFKNEKFHYNSEIPHNKLRSYIKLGLNEEKFLKNAIDRYALSLRSVHKILKVARTIADLEESENVNLNHLSEALQYKFIENSLAKF